MTVYATEDDLTAKLSATYTVPADADALLARASELIDEFTLARAQVAYDSEEDAAANAEPTPYRDALRDAACFQVEFWLEVGPEHDISGLRGSLVAGRLQVHPVARTLAPRAKRVLSVEGIYWLGGVAAG